MKSYMTLPEWIWWAKGECVVRVIKTGHYPTTAIVQLPNDLITEVDIDELENIGAK
jgi:hypothetical protein